MGRPILLKSMSSYIYLFAIISFISFVQLKSFHQLFFLLESSYKKTLYSYNLHVTKNQNFSVEMNLLEDNYYVYNTENEKNDNSQDSMTTRSSLTHVESNVHNKENSDENNNFPTTKATVKNQESSSTTSLPPLESSPVIAFAVSLTHCREDILGKPFPVVDAAAVLQKMIHYNSIHNINGTGRYDYKLYAIHHPETTEECAKSLQAFGYELLEREFPVKVSQIQGLYLRSHIADSGCCGERELIKLEIFKFTQHPLVVMLDLDMILLKPLDELFDFLLYGILPSSPSSYNSLSYHFMNPQKINSNNTNNVSNNVNSNNKLYAAWKSIDILYTIEYTSTDPWRATKPVQGGFIIVRPNQTVFDDFVAIVRKGDYRRATGWGGKSHEFWGGHTFQGLIPYYFHNLHSGRSIELNWCTYNNGCAPPRIDVSEDDSVGPIYGKCYTNNETCEDCRLRDPTDIHLFHYTFCLKPWSCTPHVHNQSVTQDDDQYDLIEARTTHYALCRAMHHAWFNVRAAIEQSWGRSGWNEGNFDRNHFYGSCKMEGKTGYIPIQKPYFNSIAS